MIDPTVTYPMCMTPHFSERPWGGQRLARVLGKDVPAEGGPYGEAWELSDHPEGRSRVANGMQAGRYFGDLLREWPQRMIGLDEAPERYPLLVKYIDAAEDLSIQVHPNDEQAPEGDRGKTECWFVMDCKPGAEIIVGLEPGVDAEGLRGAAQSGEMEEVIRRLPIYPGCFLYIPAGTVHAILGGTLICEVQQSSNTTYRLWDWNRKPARPLHIEESIAVTNYDPCALPNPTDVREQAPGDWMMLVTNEYFEVRTARMERCTRNTLEMTNPHGLIVNVVEGSGHLQCEEGEPWELKPGSTWYIPARLERWTVESGEDGLRLLVSRSLELDASTQGGGR